MPALAKLGAINSCQKLKEIPDTRYRSFVRI